MYCKRRSPGKHSARLCEVLPSHSEKAPVLAQNSPTLHPHRNAVGEWAHSAKTRIPFGIYISVTNGKCASIQAASPGSCSNDQGSLIHIHKPSPTVDANPSQVTINMTINTNGNMIDEGNGCTAPPLRVIKDVARTKQFVSEGPHHSADLMGSQ